MNTSSKYLAALVLGALCLSTFMPTAGQSEDWNYPIEYNCEDGARITLDTERATATVWLKGERTLLIPARYAQGRTWFYQVEPQEEDCSRACVQLRLDKPVTAYVLVDGVGMKCAERN